jgi:hypothetical protein
MYEAKFFPYYKWEEFLQFPSQVMEVLVMIWEERQRALKEQQEKAARGVRSR